MIKPDDTILSQDTLQTLPEPDWQARRERDLTAVRDLVSAHLDRHARKQAHPVMDFLFAYYSFSPARLLRWSPGCGVVLEGTDAEAQLDCPGFTRRPDGVALDPAAFPQHRAGAARGVIALLQTTRERAPQFGCHGLHEWAMVLDPSDIRHTRVPLRLPHAALAAFVRAQPVACSHYDAFRFFSKSARPLNRLQPRPDTRLDLEQAGCLHANMDLYKWAYKFYPWIPSGLIIDCFLLAVEARELDMRASPYDLAGLGYSPICIETDEGARVYREAQEQIYWKSRPLRDKLLAAYRRMLAWAEPGSDAP